MQNEQKQLDARVHGNVHGVLFRANTKSNAHELGLAGWVSNESDGSVRVVAEGSESRLRALLEFLTVGPSAADVENVDAEWKEPTGDYQGFDIRG